MVYDATKSGLNDAVWAPWFAIPNVDCHLRAAEVGTFMADCDVGGDVSKLYVRTISTASCGSGLE